MIIFNSFFNLPSSRMADFKITFWGGLYSGIISGVVTGLIVGIVIWLLQSKHEKKQLQKTCEREVSLFLEEAKRYIGGSNASLISQSGLGSIPENARDFIQFIEDDKPLPFWESNIEKDYIKVVRKIILVKTYYYKLSQASSHLDTIIANEFLKYTDTLNYPYYMKYFYGLLNGYSIESLQKWSHHPKYLSEEKLKTINGVINEESLRSDIQKYKDRRKQFIAEFEDLEKTLIG
ncbi:hypothetical protein [Anaerobacillus sp. 1_MG-2023]|uniref:hypothetical protein n=1 Tax=Anaerobacillus sp. 1_MG-2023 TaxID=3062655 RepID=UPI0026E37071|nr:hypothetical protein [Anaerobacillus sp. 1_MG-2023]MDO6658680.1 hypothetical protein [Anaerobacillus sp. 1_MG-2023]